MPEPALLVSIICACVSAIALMCLIVTWAIKCILEWLDDIAYWWKELKERRSRH